MISLTVITAFLTTIITLFFNFLSNAWKDLGKEAKDAYATIIQNFVEEVKKDFTDKLAKRRIKEPNDFEGNLLNFGEKTINTTTGEIHCKHAIFFITR